MPQTRVAIQTPASLLSDVTNDYSQAERQFEQLRGIFVDLGEEGLAKLDPTEQERKRIARDALLRKLLWPDENVPALAIVVNVAGRPGTFPDVLRSLAHQSFVEEHPDRVEVVLVQDGSRGVLDEPVLRDVLEATAEFHPATRLQAFRLAGDRESRGRGTARNIGIWHADRRTDVIMFLDDAMILDKHFVAEQMLRHKYVTIPLALLGFKQNRPFDNFDEYKRQRAKLLSERPDFRKDWKWEHELKEDEVTIEQGVIGFDYDGQHYKAGDCINYMRITENFKALFGNKPIGHRALPMFFQTGLTSVKYDSVLSVGGFEEAFDVGVWGFEDSYLGLLLSVKGVRLVPCPSSVAYKVEIKDEEPDANKILNIEYHRQTFWELASKRDLDFYNELKLQQRVEKLWHLDHVKSVELNAPVRASRPSAHSSEPPSDMAHNAGHLPIGRPRYPSQKLFGAETALSTALPVLRLTGLPPLISIEGLGGLGKTTLAQQLTNTLLVERVFEASAWYSVRQSDFDARHPGALAQHQGAPLVEVVYEIQRQLGLRVPGMEPENAKLETLLSELARSRFLVVIDNVETDQDLVPLVPMLSRMNEALPTKVIVTSRIAIEPHCPSFSVPLTELEETESIKLLRYQGQLRNIAAIHQADDRLLKRIFEVVGGNPLALNLSLGLVRHFDIEAVVADLESAKGTKSDALYQWIYWRSWYALTEDSKQLLLVMRKFGVDGTDRARLEGVSEMKGSKLDRAIEQLANMSLMVVVGPIERRTYAIHRLTRTFLQEIVKKWDQDKQLAPFKEFDAAADRANLVFTHDLLKRHIP